MGVMGGRMGGGEGIKAENSDRIRAAGVMGSSENGRGEKHKCGGHVIWCRGGCEGRAHARGRSDKSNKVGSEEDGWGGMWSEAYDIEGEQDKQT